MGFGGCNSNMFLILILLMCCCGGGNSGCASDYNCGCGCCNG